MERDKQFIDVDVIHICECVIGSASIHAGTHYDMLKTAQEAEEIGRRVVMKYHRRFPAIRGFHAVCSHNGVGVESLLDSMVNTALRQPYIPEYIPQPYLQLEAHLQEVHVRGGALILSSCT